jgi:hypothetical protein
MKSAKILLVVAALAGCGLLEPESRERQEFNDALAAWKRQGVDNYYFVQQRSCECLEEWVRPARVVVRGGRVVEAIDVEDGVLRNLEYYMTIDALFAHIRDAFDQHAYRIEIEYDRTLHYPISVFIDRDRNVADEELSLHVSGLTRIP